METYVKIFKATVSLYPSILSQQHDEEVWIVADSVSRAVEMLKSEYQQVTVSRVSTIFGHVITIDNFDYQAEVYEVDMRLAGGTIVKTYAIANSASEAIILCMEDRSYAVSANVLVLPGTVFPKNSAELST